nr:alcohol dehydrogenase catalytic domain-containing protein [Pedobacter kyonggii]
MPLIPGHEAIGVVAALGHGVKNMKDGDVVGGAWLFSACGCCEFCITGLDAMGIPATGRKIEVNLGILPGYWRDKYPRKFEQNK